MKTLISLCTALIFAAVCSGTALCCMPGSDNTRPGKQESNLKETQTGKKKLPIPAAKPGEIIVKFKPGIAEKRIREIAAKEGLEVIKNVSPPSLYLMKSRETSPALLDKKITELKKYKEIEYAEPNYTYKPVRN